MRGTNLFVDSINDSVRLLIIFETAHRLKPAHRITENRIRLYDYYLRFPNTMLSNNKSNKENKANLDEYYAFFHWKPDVVRYRSCLNYLVARSLVEKKLENGDVFYTVLPQGEEALSNVKNSYKQRLVDLSEQIFPIVSKLSERKIEEEIIERARTISRDMEGSVHEL